MDRRAHPVQDILFTLQRELRVDAEWVMPIDNGFQWWPGPLAQRIWIEDTEPKRLHIETDVLRHVAIDENDAKCPFLAEAFGADPDFTSHPTKGRRESGHVLPHFLDALGAENEKVGSLSELDFTP